MLPYARVKYSLSDVALTPKAAAIVRGVVTRAEGALHLVAGCGSHPHLRTREQEAGFRR